MKCITIVVGPADWPLLLSEMRAEMKRNFASVKRFLERIETRLNSEFDRLLIDF